MEQPVTVIVRRRVHADRTKEFEAWQRKAMTTAATFPGHLGAEVIRPEDPASQDYVVIFRFATSSELDVWEKSPERARLLAEVEPISDRYTIEKVTGLEYWFSLPGGGAKAPPPRWKMATVTVVAIYPLVMFYVPLMGKQLESLPHWVATLVTVCSMVAGMTWFVMPFLTRAFARFLYPLS